MAQPAVSEQVRKLEEELGVRLFDRTQRRVSLTPMPAPPCWRRRGGSCSRPRSPAWPPSTTPATGPRRGFEIGHVPDSNAGAQSRAPCSCGASAPRIQISLETGGDAPP